MSMTACQILGLLAVISSVSAETCKDGQCTMPADHPTGEAKGLSLMQSGRSVLPASMEHKGVSVLSDGSVDEFAAMEDEFDDAYAEDYAASRTENTASKPSAITSKSSPLAPLLKHANDPYLYAETLLVIVFFALAARVFKLISSHDSCLRVFAQSRAEAQKTAEATVTPKPAATSQEKAPIIIQGGSKDFATLEEAVRASDEPRCLQILKEGGRRAVRQEDAFGCTALHVAAHCGSAPMIRLLLDNGAKVDAREAWDETPLHLAARSGSMEVCSILLANGAEVDAANASGWTPLVAAGHAKQEAVCELLLSHGAGAGGVADDEMPPLVNALLVRRIFARSSEVRADATEASKVPEE